MMRNAKLPKELPIGTITTREAAQRAIADLEQWMREQNQKDAIG